MTLQLMGGFKKGPIWNPSRVSVPRPAGPTGPAWNVHDLIRCPEPNTAKEMFLLPGAWSPAPTSRRS